MRAHREQLAIAAPLYTSYSVGWTDVAELCHFAIGCGPQVDAGTEAYSEHILRRPVNQV